jgi:hypothetical protein
LQGVLIPSTRESGCKDKGDLQMKTLVRFGTIAGLTLIMGQEGDRHGNLWRSQINRQYLV